MILNIDDLRERARRRLPRILWDWVEGGAEDETGVKRNASMFAAHRLVPRYCLDTSARDLQATLFGRRYRLPFGIAPTGYTGLLRPGGERMMLAAADAADVPYVLSGVSVASLEEISAASPGRAWFQLYPALDREISRDLACRARDAGYPVLVLTVDMPIEAKRERDIRNGFTLPLRYTPRLVWDGLTHAPWTVAYLRSGGLPTLGSWARYVRRGASPVEVVQFQFAQHYPQQTWADVEQYRRLWPGQLVLKGVLHPDDARRAADLGVDGIIVSNHGARQLDRAVAPLEALPAVRDAVGDRLAVMLDGGVRRGSDIAVALALGADYVFSGRAILYGVIAGGTGGASQAIEILRDELSRVMAQLGALSVAELGPGVFMDPPTA